MWSIISSVCHRGEKIYFFSGEGEKNINFFSGVGRNVYGSPYSVHVISFQENPDNPHTDPLHYTPEGEVN